MKPNEIIESLARLVAVSPEKVSIECADGVMIITSIQENMSRLVGRRGAFIDALSLIARMIDAATVNLLDPVPDVAPVAWTKPAPKTLAEELLKALGQTPRVTETESAVIVTIPAELPETARLALTTLIKSAGRSTSKPMLVNDC